MRIIGLDLAGLEKNPTGFCLLEEEIKEICLLYEDQEIIDKIERTKPDLIAIDAPLSLPREGNLRKAEIDLRKLGIKFFPPLLLGMKKLTLRAIKLKNIIENKGFEVIEVFPGALYDVLKIPRKSKGELLKKFNASLNRKLTDHEIDSIACALIGKLFLEGKFSKVGDEREGEIVIPDYTLR
jgi:hypothetical protein